MLLIVLMHTAFDKRLFSQLERIQPLDTLRKHVSSVRSGGPQTTLLVRYSKDEAEQIRAAAKRSGTTISAFVLHALRIAWEVQDRIARESASPESAWNTQAS